MVQPNSARERRKCLSVLLYKICVETNLKHIEIVGHPPLVADLELEDVKLKVDYIDVSFNPDFVVDVDVNVTIQSP